MNSNAPAYSRFGFGPITSIHGNNGSKEHLLLVGKNLVFINSALNKQAFKSNPLFKIKTDRESGQGVHSFDVALAV